MVSYELLKMYRSSLNDSSILTQRSTFLSDVDQLAALQLSIIFLQKKLGLNADISEKELFSYHDKIKKLKDSFNIQSIIDDEPFSTNFNGKELLNNYNLFLKHCNMIDKIDVKNFSLNNQKDTLDSKGLTFSPGSQTPVNSDIVQFRRVIVGYFQLLVNTRDEIALARVIDLPSRGIDHAAFTEIRKLAMKKSMPMYQVVCSFSRQVLLGGKGYNPNKSHVLFKHKEGLVDFIQLVDKLQTVLDDSNLFKNGILQMFKILKNAFVKAKVPIFSTSLVSQTFINMSQDLSEFIGDQPLHANVMLCLRDFLDYISYKHGNSTISATSAQLCGVLSTPIPNSSIYVKLTSFSTKFTTPEVNEETPKKEKTMKQIKGNSCARPLVELQMDYSRKQSGDNDIAKLSSTPSIRMIRCPKSPLKKVTEQPSKTYTKENDEKKKRQTKPLKRKNSREKSHVLKKLNVLPGQKKLTSFFA